MNYKDRHTTDHAPPAIDSQQDWTLLHGEENDHGTILRFVRKLDTCDRDDLIINVCPSYCLQKFRFHVKIVFVLNLSIIIC